MKTFTDNGTFKLIKDVFKLVEDLEENNPEITEFIVQQIWKKYHEKKEKRLTETYKNYITNE